MNEARRIERNKIGGGCLIQARGPTVWQLMSRRNSFLVATNYFLYFSSLPLQKKFSNLNSFSFLKVSVPDS